MLKFVQNCIAHVPVECLVEHYQILAVATREHDWERVQTAMDCIAEAVGRYTETPDGVKFKPSVSTAIALGCQNGILAQPDGTDVPCEQDHGISEAMLGGVLQQHCDACPRLGNGCQPDEMCIMLKNGLLYDGTSGAAEAVAYME